jgi:hypothetical protein
MLSTIKIKNIIGIFTSSTTIAINHSIKSLLYQNKYSLANVTKEEYMKIFEPKEKIKSKYTFLGN